ncbi:hypothetical protein D6D20_01269 [Aureobasidium pullulans]|uniref:3'-5' exonuclease domain-containing protein n=1 Tax=Aureobasidium pullulans TaxID=5580 RepID=A0A4S8ZKG4_AURPU|nr:hypothetical protein D6D20_01269 [Aureobasidium pullulans]THZ96849.1 hypothetical protein D6C82_06793 [Aureobasidium pullulans]
MSTILIDSEEGVRHLIEEIESSSLQPPFLFMDLEGIYLGRLGSISILQLLVPPNPIVRLLDVHVLQRLAFETKSTTGTTFKDILESDRYPKIFFDLRNDSDALYSHFGIRLQSVIDIQMLEFGTRIVPGRFLKSLAKSIEEDSGINYYEVKEWQAGKEAGYMLFDPLKGGSYDVFNHRPLDEAIVDYCSRDVQLLPALLQAYARRLRGWENLAINLQSEAEKRVSLSQSATYNSKCQHMAQGPKGIQYCSSNGSRLTFPMSLVLSPDLPQYCIMMTETPEEMVGTSTPTSTCLPEASTELVLEKSVALEV